MRLITSIRKPAARAIATASKRVHPILAAHRLLLLGIGIASWLGAERALAGALIEFPNLSGQAIAERMGETPAELPFIGDQVVCLSHNQAARSGPRKEARVPTSTATRLE